MSSIKDALMKAGFRPTKKENERERRPKFEQVQKSVIHQEQRNYCESCQMVHPDVEHYKHRNPTVEAEWICVACADRHMISDEFRVSNQSDFAKRNLFRREFGRTKRASEFVKPGPAGKQNIEGNKNSRETKRYADAVEDKYERQDRKTGRRPERTQDRNKKFDNRSSAPAKKPLPDNNKK